MSWYKWHVYLSLRSFTALTSLEKSKLITVFFFKSSQIFTNMRKDVEVETTNENKMA